jgi:3D-(3,5/4)-trihydroxycyclohexane-1,2-dione acylhydrolase (decyclizing)
VSNSTRMTTAAALVRYLIAQRTEIDGVDAPLFPGVFAIFGHGNVTSLGLALQEVGDALPTWRGQNEQGMALAAVGYAKARRRRQIMVATSSIGPGALNMVTAAGVAHANRLPLLLLVGDTFASRLPDPVLQQVEHFGNPSVTVNDAFRPVSRYWDRIVRPSQLIQSLPHAVSVMLDAAECGPAVLCLPQDVQAEAYDFPNEMFAPVVHRIARPRPDLVQLEQAANVLRGAKRPLLIAGGGVHYSGAEAALASFAEQHAVPVVETVAGKATLTADHRLNAGPIGVTGCVSANALAADADVVVAVGTRLQDFTTGSWTCFAPGAQFVGINTAAFDAVKHRSQPVVGDAAESLTELDALLGAWRADDTWVQRAAAETVGYHRYIDEIADAAAITASGLPTYAQVVGVVDRMQQPGDYVVTAAGGFPGELNNGWRAQQLNSFDCEYGFSCMGYEISGAWGAKMAQLADTSAGAAAGEVIVFVTCIRRSSPAIS